MPVQGIVIKSEGDVVRKISRMLVACGVSVVFLASCMAHVGDDQQGKAPLQPLSCIAVMPAGTSIDKDEVVGTDQARSLENGATFATGIMARELSGNSKVRVVSREQAAALSPEVSGGLFGMVAAIGKKVGCDGVLVTTVRRFKQREGSEYASGDPASADVHMALVHAANGAVLWTADVRETQESFLSNILSFEKMQNRGFKWISVEQLVEQGITEHLATCPYLQ